MQKTIVSGLLKRMVKKSAYIEPGVGLFVSEYKPNELYLLD